MRFIKWLSEANTKDEDVHSLGSKAATLAKLTRTGCKIPEAFCITTDAYEEFTSAHQVAAEIESQLKTVNQTNLRGIEAASKQIRRCIESKPLPELLTKEITNAYQRLGGCAVAVRSSASLEDLSTASFAGQYDSFINISGVAEVISRVKSVWSSLWTARAIVYRRLKQLDQGKASMAVLVQRLVDAEAGGVLFTKDPFSKTSNVMIIEGAWGLGDSVTSGSVDPDRFWVDRSNLKVIKQALASKSLMRVPSRESGTIDMPTPNLKRDTPCITSQAVAELARLSLGIESLFGAPQDIEWALSDESFYIIQSRPLQQATKQ
ncbi:MAG: hypothetical protein M1503_03625 [Thaumarchaeota archaeon]|nr:hypothetical protein [Nitrososphaerota archaeon]MCL5317343.1 hypothetical protein [Nitrososphaerota archaeon]